MDCVRCVELLPLVVDGELDPAMTAVVDAHVQGCPGCRGHEALERAFVGTLRRWSCEGHAPGELRDRIAAVLDQEDATRERDRGLKSRRALRRGIAITGAGAMLIAVGALAPALFSSTPPRLPASNPAQIHGRLECLACDLASRRPRPGLETLMGGTTRPGPENHGRLHLRDDDGNFWELVPDGPDAAMLEDHALAGRPVTVFGRLEPELHVMRVARVHAEAATPH